MISDGGICMTQKNERIHWPHIRRWRCQGPFADGLCSQSNERITLNYFASERPKSIQKLTVWCGVVLVSQRDWNSNPNANKLTDCRAQTKSEKEEAEKNTPRGSTKETKVN